MAIGANRLLFPTARRLGHQKHFGRFGLRCLTALCAGLLLAACQTEQAVQSQTTVSAQDSSAPAAPERGSAAYLELRRQAGKVPQRVPEALLEPIAEGSAPAKVVARVLQDLQVNHVLPADELQVILAVAREYPDGSMDCPEPGARYTMAPVQGYQVVVDHAGQPYDYRISKSGILRLCSGPTL